MRVSDLSCGLGGLAYMCMDHHQEYTHGVISLEPVPGQHGEIARRSRKRDRNARTAQDSDATKTPGSLVECKGREVEKGTNLVLHLKSIGHVLSRRNWTISSVHPILP